MRDWILNMRLWVWVLLQCSWMGFPAICQHIPLSPSPLAWSGGLNSCQFCEIDLNADGVHDLLVFDRHGNRILPLICPDQPGSLNYLPDTSLVSKFPDLHDWVITADYDCDGRMDLFTYGLGGIRVFRNVSDPVLEFREVTSMLTSWYYSGYIGILVTPVDYPAISDIDGDGDLDILTFSGLGSFVEFHQNLSMEKYGSCDSLDFRMADNCWGKFKENEGSNRITLNADCPFSKYDVRSVIFELDSGSLRLTSGEKHTGSTLLATDLNGDGMKDLILGDVDFPNLIALFNGGTADTAFMTGMDTLYPSPGKSVHLFDFPVVSLVDVDHDGLKDMLVSPFDPVLTNAEDLHSIWYYRNTGNVVLPQFTWQTSGLFQQDMLDLGSNSYPVLHDLDGDGKDDLLVGNWGRYDSSWYESGILKSAYTGSISYFKNTGDSSHPVFTFITGDLGSFSAYGLTGIYPAAGDITGDGFPDLLLGQDDGTLAFLENSGTGSLPPVFLTPVWKFQGIDVGENSTPQLFDFNEDGLADLIIGEKNGNLNYYENKGTQTAPQFVLITDSLGKVNVTNYQLSWTGYSTPCFFRDRSGNTGLLTGCEEGRIWYFPVSDQDPSTRYEASDSLFSLISGTRFPLRCGWRTSPAIGFLSDSLKMDLLVGNFSGGLNYFSQQGPPDLLLDSPGDLFHRTQNISLFPNPASNECTIEVPGYSVVMGLILELYNIPGQLILRQILQGIRTFSVAGLPDGVYFVHLRDPLGEHVIPATVLVVRH